MFSTDKYFLRDLFVFYVRARHRSNSQHFGPNILYAPEAQYQGIKISILIIGKILGLEDFFIRELPFIPSPEKPINILNAD